MRLEYLIERTNATIGTDAVPTNAAYLANDNVWRCPQYGPNSEPLEAIAIGYTAPAGAAAVELDLYMWDEHTAQWYRFGETVIPRGEVRYVSLPNVVCRLEDRTRSVVAVAVVAAVMVAPPAGDYDIVLSASTGYQGVDLGGSLAAIIAWLIAIEADTTAIEADTTAIAASAASIDGKLENPMPVEGATAVGAVPASDPLDMGSVVLDADPAPYANGNIQRTRLDSLGRLIVRAYATILGGLDADDDPATANPVLIGGKHIADPYADPIDDGDAGYALLNELRMLITESRVYDPPTDADRNVPVFIQADRYDTTEIAGSTAVDASFYYYFDLNGCAYFTVEFIPVATGTGANITMTYQVSDQDSQPDITARAYSSDMSLSWFGAASYASGAGGTTAYAHEKDTATGWSSMRVRVDVAGRTGGTPAWTLRVRKMAH